MGLTEGSSRFNDRRIVAEAEMGDRTRSTTSGSGQEIAERGTGAKENALEFHALALPDGRQSEAAADIARGTMRLLAQLNFVPVMEMTLANNRRADIAAIGPKGEIWIVEIKSCLTDYRSDSKWPDYADYCDRFYFAVNADFPSAVIPDDSGLIIADRYAAEVVRDSPEAKLSGARRKAVTLRFARAGGHRLHALIDPDNIIPRFG